MGSILHAQDVNISECMHDHSARSLFLNGDGALLRSNDRSTGIPEDAIESQLFEEDLLTISPSSDTCATRNAEPPQDSVEVINILKAGSQVRSENIHVECQAVFERCSVDNKIDCAALPQTSTSIHTLSLSPSGSKTLAKADDDTAEMPTEPQHQSDMSTPATKNTSTQTFRTLSSLDQQTQTELSGDGGRGAASDTHVPLPVACYNTRRSARLMKTASV